MPMSKHHRLKAAIGIFLGLGIATGAAVGAYYNWKPDEWNEFGLLVIAAIPFAVWGCAHLARARAYPSDIAYVLVFLTVVAVDAIPASPMTPPLFFVIFIFFFVFSLLIMFFLHLIK